jgi:PAS domain S-box-containing protein
MCLRQNFRDKATLPAAVIMNTNTPANMVVELSSHVLALDGPIWKQWWFLTLAAAVALVVFELYRRARLKRFRAALEESQQSNEQLQRRIVELGNANRALTLEYQLILALAESTTLSEAAPLILRSICESAGWEVGALWEVDENAQLLRCVETSRLSGGAPEFEKLTRASVFEPGTGLPGRVWQSVEAHWITDLTSDRNFPRIAAAVDEGIRSAYAFPSLAGDRVTGVLEFFSHELREPDEDMIKRISAAGNHIGQLIERKRAEDALRDSEVHFRSVAESASDAIITIDEKSSIIAVNPATQKIFGYSTAELIDAPLTMLMPEYIRHLHRSGIDRYITTNRKHISWLAVELPGLHKSGHEIPLEISFCEWTRKGTRYFTGIIRDVSERRHAQAALRRTREERLRELERVRTRIAADLHDDIGSSLTKIVILSDVAQQSGSENGAAKESLDAISEISNELVESMSDIVWAINPKKDQLSELSHRMRRFASDMFTARKIKFQFRAQFDEDVQLGANVRREVFLIFKESVNNVVRHSRCTEAAAQFSIEDGRLMLQVKDNGQGLKPAASKEATSGVYVSAGNGLPSMNQRASDLGGEFRVISIQGEGTTVWLSVPLAGLSEN